MWSIAVLIFNILCIQIGFLSATHLSVSNYLISANSEVCDYAMQLPGGTLYVFVCVACIQRNSPSPQAFNYVLATDLAKNRKKTPSVCVTLKLIHVAEKWRVIEAN